MEEGGKSRAALLQAQEEPQALKKGKKRLVQQHAAAVRALGDERNAHRREAARQAAIIDTLKKEKAGVSHHDGSYWLLRTRSESI